MVSNDTLCRIISSALLYAPGTREEDRVGVLMFEVVLGYGMRLFEMIPQVSKEGRRRVVLPQNLQSCLSA
uniref:Uncharacterized protein n=1 Tax=viral metagenome TaxID=1070528 RepID=A0A6C0BYX9_9ZZZZ